MLPRPRFCYLSPVAGGYARSPARINLALRAPLIVLLLASGSFELHSSSGEHSLTAARETISVDARHAREAAHFETSKLETRAVCLACLLHHSAGLESSALGIASEAAAGRRLAQRRLAPALAPARTRGNPRAPPTS